jgi:hypothetical protein
MNSLVTEILHEITTKLRHSGAHGAVECQAPHEVLEPGIGVSGSHQGGRRSSDREREVLCRLSRLDSLSAQHNSRLPLRKQFECRRVQLPEGRNLR